LKAVAYNVVNGGANNPTIYRLDQFENQIFVYGRDNNPTICLQFAEKLATTPISK
jgi:hypothetical protein